MGRCQMSPMPLGWRVGVGGGRVVLAVPSGEADAGYTLKPGEGRALADQILRACVLSFEGREVIAEDAPIRWIVALTSAGIRLSVSPVEPSGIYVLMAAEAAGLGTALIRGCEIAERLGGQVKSDGGGRVIEETLRRISGHKSLLDIGSEDVDHAARQADWDTRATADDDQGSAEIEWLKNPSSESMKRYRKFVDEYLDFIEGAADRDGAQEREMKEGDDA